MICGVGGVGGVQRVASDMWGGGGGGVQRVASDMWGGGGVSRE